MEGNVVKVENSDGGVYLTVKIEHPDVENFHHKYRTMIRYGMITDKEEQEKMVSDFEKSKEAYNNFLKTVYLGKVTLEYIK